MRADDDLDDVVLLERLCRALLVGRDGRKVLEDVVDRDGGRERDALGCALDLVVERLDALLDQLVALEAELEDVGALGRLLDQLLDDAVDDTGRGLVLVESGGGDCMRSRGGNENQRERSIREGGRGQEGRGRAFS